MANEKAIIVACARRNIDPRKVDRITAWLSDDVDWTRLVELTIRESLAGLVFRNLEVLPGGYVPEAIREAARIHLRATQAQNRCLAAELLKIISALEDRGIPAIPFKGPLLAQSLYGDLGLRRFGDLDFLIRQQDVSDCLSVVKQLGYRTGLCLSPIQEARYRSYSGQHLLIHRSGRVAIEPHWALTPSMLAVAIDYEGIWRRARHEDFEGHTVLSLDPADLAHLLCINGSKDEWRRLKSISDVEGFLKAYPQLDWNGVLLGAKKSGTLRMVLLALYLANRVMEAPVPAPASDIINVDRTVHRLGQIVAERLFNADTATSIDRISLFRLLMRERWQDRRAYLVRTAITPRTVHYTLVRLPDRLFFLYYLIKILHDYMALPIWCTGKALVKGVKKLLKLNASSRASNVVHRTPD